MWAVRALSSSTEKDMDTSHSSGNKVSRFERLRDAYLQRWFSPPDFAWFAYLGTKTSTRLSQEDQAIRRAYEASLLRRRGVRR